MKQQLLLRDEPIEPAYGVRREPGPLIGNNHAEPMNLSVQTALLNRTVARGLELADELARLGYTYDNLRYRRLGEAFSSRATYQTPEDFNYPANEVPTVAFFAGSGGLDLGFEYAGFRQLGSFEINKDCCSTLRRNRPSWRVFGPPSETGDLRNREETVAALRRELGIGKDFEGVFHGGPPCLSFSVAANQRFPKGKKDFKRIGFSHSEHGGLLLDFVHYIEVFRPRVFLIENVPGLASIDKGKQLESSMGRLTRRGYEVAGPALINMRDHSVPQERQRLFICGWRGSGTFAFPSKNTLTVPSWIALKKQINGAHGHVTRRHKAQSILRYMELDLGERDQLGRVQRLDPRVPSKTVIAGGTRGGGRSHLHPLIPRTLSPRECARLQTFPDRYRFEGCPARQLTQIGNAVPPLFSMKLARAIYETLYA